METSSSWSISQSTRTLPRGLATTVDVFSREGGEAICQVRADLSTPSNGTVGVVTYGAVFTVTSIANSIDLQALEFSTGSKVDVDDLQPTVQIWALNGTTISQNRTDWIKLTSTQAVGSPDGLSAVVPRTDISRPLTMGPGETWTLLASFGSAKVLQMQETDKAIGVVLQEDPYMKINVGQGIGSGEDPFAAIGTTSAVFQGRLHYHVLKPCESMPATTTFPFPIAVKSGIDKTELTNSVQDAFSSLLKDSAGMVRWTQVYGLTLDSVEIGSKEEDTEDCKQYGFEAGCDIYTTQALFEHHASLDSRELILDLLLKLPFQDGYVLDFDGLAITYTGVDALAKDFEISLTGLPSGTILSPIQRGYMADVVYNFIESSSAVVPHRVEVSQTARRKLLRSRELQEEQELLTVATISGIGNDADDFQKDIDAAFQSENAQFLRELQRRQYLPGPINDGADLGAMFADVTDVSIWVRGETAPIVPGTVGGGDSNGMSNRKIQLIAFSVGLGLAVLFLAYRLLKDCILVKRGFHVENKKLSEKTTASDDSSPAPEHDDKDIKPETPNSSFGVDNLTGIKNTGKASSFNDDMSIRSSRSHRSALESAARGQPNRTLNDGEVRGTMKGGDDDSTIRRRSSIGDPNESRASLLEGSTRGPPKTPSGRTRRTVQDGSSIQMKASGELEEASGSIRSIRSVSDSSHRGPQTPRKGEKLRRTQSAVQYGSSLPRKTASDLDESTGSNRSMSDSSRRAQASPKGRVGVRRIQSAVQNGSTPPLARNKSPDIIFSPSMSNIETPETPSGNSSKFRGKRPISAQSLGTAALSPVNESATPLRKVKHLPRVNSSVGKSPRSTSRPAAMGTSSKKSVGSAETSGATETPKSLKKRVGNEESFKKKRAKDKPSDCSPLKNTSPDLSSSAKKLRKKNSSTRNKRSPQSRVDMAGVTS